ncbi:MAG: gh2E [Anaerocolumna sp.]|jgi:beta-galactosidase|nr:gh2E [Anaerocolumna sp.]
MEEEILRNCIKLNDNWKYQRSEDCMEETVQLPHTWNALDGQDGGNDYYRGTCIYRKILERPELTPGGRAYLEFRGANLSAIVKVNGLECGTHEGGYSTFRVDITDALQEKNLVEIMVDNAPTRRVYPQKADFTFYGGIYRDVYLITVPESHFELDYYGAPGIMVTPEVHGTKATIRVKTFITGVADAVRVSIDGVGTTEIEVKERETEAIFTIDNVHLWNGLIDPYLYHAKAELQVAGEIVDIVNTRFGCRTYSFDKEQGFFLNGKAYPLHGVSRHQDRKGVGNALTKEMHEEDMQMILDMGANAIRLAHYQHDQYFYDLCDEKGLVAWAEIPYITEHMPEANENTINQMIELVVQNYNHPSIICWALSNEITVSGMSDDLIENHRRLNELVHNLDSTRVTAIANVFILDTDSPLIDVPDIMSYNLYFGWYVGELEENDVFFDKFHSQYPDKIIGLSEYGADTFYKLQSPEPVRGDYSEQYQCVYHEHMLEMFATRPYLWSTFVWSMFDFAADGREEADDNGVNHKGLVTFDRKVKKDAYFIYKAWWSKEPFVHLCGSRYVDRTEEITEIKVYSNQLKVELYKDGVLMDEKSGKHVFTFQVPINGEHKIEARCGELVDTIKIQKVSEPNISYRLRNAAVRNWFDEPGMEVVPGYFSIKDKIGDIKKAPEGKALIDAMMQQAVAAFGDVAKNVQGGAAMEQMMNNSTMESMAKMVGGAIAPDMIIAINKQLNKIKKPECE